MSLLIVFKQIEDNKPDEKDEPSKLIAEGEDGE